MAIESSEKAIKKPPLVMANGGLLGGPDEVQR